MLGELSVDRPDSGGQPGQEREAGVEHDAQQQRERANRIERVQSIGPGGSWRAPHTKSRGARTRTARQPNGDQRRRRATATSSASIATMSPRPDRDRRRRGAPPRTAAPSRNGMRKLTEMLPTVITAACHPVESETSADREQHAVVDRGGTRARSAEMASMPFGMRRHVDHPRRRGRQDAARARRTRSRCSAILAAVYCLGRHRQAQDEQLDLVLALLHDAGHHQEDVQDDDHADERARAPT